MSARPAAGLADTIRSAVRRITAPADAELLAAFARDRDPAAFEALVRRHGQLVANVCRGILPSSADADDAAQATFLVLFRRAATIRPATLPGWLFRVARRAAVEVKRAADRRRVVESKGASREAVIGPDVSWREAVAILHEELDRLPARYRDPLILCYLDGRARDEAATTLGCSIDALRGRLDQGRAKLGARLRTRGVTLSVGLLATVAGPGPAPAEVVRHVLQPSSTVESVARAVAGPVRGWAAGSAVAVAATLFLGMALVEIGTADPPKKADRPTEVARAPRFDAYGDPLPEWAVARLGTTRLNNGGIETASYTADGKRIVMTAVGSFGVWDAETGRELRYHTVPSENIPMPVVTDTSDPTILLVDSRYGDSVRWWDTRQNRVVRTLKTPARSIRVVSPNGQRLVVRTDQDGQVIDLASGNLLAKLTNEDGTVFKPVDVGYQQTAFVGPDHVILADRDNRLRVWEAPNGRLVRTIQCDIQVAVLEASADGRFVAGLEHGTGAINKYLPQDTVHVWDVRTGAKVHALVVGPDRWIMGIGFSADGRFLATCSAGKQAYDATVWDLTTGKSVCVLPNLTGLRPALSPDGRRLLIGTTVWDVPSGKRILPAGHLHTQTVGLHLSPTGDRVLSIGYHSSGVWDGTTGRLVRRLDIPTFNSHYPRRAFSADGQFVATFEGDHLQPRLTVWDVRQNRRRFTAENAHSAVAISPDASVLATIGPGGIRLLGMADGNVVRTFKTPLPGWARFLTFTADGTTLFVIGEKITRYDVATGVEAGTWTLSIPIDDEIARRISGSNTLTPQITAVSPDGSLVAARIGRSTGHPFPDRLVLCDGRTGRLLRRWGDDNRSDREFGSLVFSHDGRLLASSDGANIHVWDVASGRRVRTFRGRRADSIVDLAFSADGRRLGSGGGDSTVLVWDLTVPPPATLDLAASWADLSADDATKSWSAVWHLADAPDDVSLPFFRDHLTPASASDVEKVRQRVRDLDSDRFGVRERAAELAKLGHLAEPVLRAGLDAKPSAEARQRIETLLDKLVGPPSAGEPLRMGRALAALERKATPAAKRLLKDLAAGADGAWLTREARAALVRIMARGL